MKCAFCGKECERRWPAQKYCSVKCAREAKREKWRARRVENRAALALQHKYWRFGKKISLEQAKEMLA